MEKYDVNRDKFIDLMAKHHEDAGVNNVWLWQKAQEGEDIMPLARKFIADRLEQCLAAWECAEGVWMLDGPRSARLDPDKWGLKKILKDFEKIIEEDVIGYVDTSHC